MNLPRHFCNIIVTKKTTVRALTIALVGLFALQVSAASAWQDALSNTEISQALDLADLTINIDLHLPLDASEANHVALQQTSAHLLGTQLLLVELKEQKKKNSDQRLAEIFTYNYNMQLAQRHIVDIQQRALVSVQDINSAHLPLSNTEIDYANWLLWNNSSLRQRVTEEVNDLQLPTSSDSIALTDARVSVWVPGSPERGAASGCDLQRCALFSLYTENQESLTTEPVVNLVTGAVFTDLPM